MRKAGSQSWRFAHDIDESLHFVLYLRDALGLQVDVVGIVPPQLAVDVPDRSKLLSQGAAAGWPSWWRTMVNQVAPRQLGFPSREIASQDLLRGVPAQDGWVVDPPEFLSLAGSPELRHAARTLWSESCRWFGAARKPYLAPSCLDMFAWEQVLDAAERAADKHEVSLGEVNGCAQILIVEGSWWQVVAPGVALCSIASARDPAIVPLLLDGTFDSYLNR